MTRPSTPPILAELRNLFSSSSQLAALQALKNEIIGHEQKKELWIGLGVLAPIARILNTHKGSGKKRHREVSGATAVSKQKKTRNDDEEARLRAVVIVGSVAYGGPVYITPLYASFVISPILALLSPSESTPQLVLASLKTLNAVADAVCLSAPGRESGEDGLLELLYKEPHISAITSILLQISSLLAQEQIASAAALISQTCRSEQHRALLTQAGVLEALALQMASFIVAIDPFLDQSHKSGSDYRYGNAIPPATSRSRMAPILRAIGTIIQHSKARAIQFLNAPAFASLLQKPDDNAFTRYERKAGVWKSNSLSSYPDRHIPSTWIEGQLPSLQSPHVRTSLASTSNYALVSAASKQPQISRSFTSALEVNQNQSSDLAEEEGSVLILWLLYFSRSRNEMIGLMAAWVLAILYQHGLTKPEMHALFTMLLVPSLTRMLDNNIKLSTGALESHDGSIVSPPDKLIKQQAPIILAMLAANSLETQKAAADAGAIKRLCRLLKDSYSDSPTNASISLWTPESYPSGYEKSQVEGPSLGHPGVSAAAYQIMRLRESVLVALAKFASDKDEYRKAIIENEVIPFIIKALKVDDSDIPSIPQPDTQNESSPGTSKELVGNTKDVVLAACGAARALSRSVSTLRTSLMDAGLAAPLFTLLKCHDMDLQIEATSVVTNLVLHFSPMQEAIMAAGALRILCKHAHSTNIYLQLNSVWALKHLVLNASSDVKKNCLQELGPGWLKQIVNKNADTANSTPLTRGVGAEDGSRTPIRMSTPNAAGEQVDILNAVEEESTQSSQDFEDDSEDDLEMADSTGTLSKVELGRKQQGLPFPMTSGRGPLLEHAGSSTRNMERRTLLHGLTDELAIQKEGLDFLRNLICGSDAYEMIDVILREFDHEKFFDVLAAKLRPKILNPFNRGRQSPENGIRHVQPQTDIIVAVCYNLVHVAAGHPRHRQLLIAQTELLKLIVPLFNHPNYEVRTCCVWLAINLTWLDDQSDSVNCKARAQELRKLGMFEKLQAMDRDEELDIRERAKTGATQMAQLLRS